MVNFKLGYEIWKENSTTSHKHETKKNPKSRIEIKPMTSQTLYNFYQAKNPPSLFTYHTVILMHLFETSWYAVLFQ